MTVTEDLKSWRIRLGMSQAVAASLVGVVRSSWAKYETGPQTDVPLVVRRAMSDVERELMS